MDRAAVEALLHAVASGALNPLEAADRLAAGSLGPDGVGFTDLGFARVDTHRGLRTGDPEVVYAGGKSPAETVSILASLRASSPDRAVLATRCDGATLSAALAASGADGLLPGAVIDVESGCVAVGPMPAPRGTVVILAAGTSDGRVAAEAAFTAAVFGAQVERITDVGVAGLHRLLAVRPALAAADCLVVVAGMDGALPSAVGGLVGTPVVAVPTSVGYGAAFGGISALLAMLTSCAPGVVVCNIDNGFGAGVFAARVARRAAAGTVTSSSSLSGTG